MVFKKNHIPWNKGLRKETDGRVKKASEKDSKTLKERYRKGELKAWNKGVPCSRETAEKISKTQIESERYKGDNNPAKRPEVGEKISNTLKGRDAYWACGPHPEHSKFMKENILHFLNLNNGFGKGNTINYEKGIFGIYISKLHKNVKSALNLLFNYSFISEIRIGSFFYDEVDDKQKIIIEVNGDVFHANPTIFKENDHPHPLDKTLTSKQIWEKDKKKKDFAEDKKYKLIYLWEKDIRSYRDEKSLSVFIQDKLEGIKND